MILNRKKNLLFSLALLLVCGQAWAQTNRGSLTPAQIRAKASQYQEYKQLLADPDPSVRFAAVSEMLKSNDKNMKTLAFDAAFLSAESALRGLALKERVLSLSSLVLEPLDEAAKEELAVIGHHGFGFKLSEPNHSTGAVRFYGLGGFDGWGSVAGEELSFQMTFTSQNTVSGHLRLGENGKMTGIVHWRNLEGKDGRRDHSGSANVAVSVN